MINVKNKPESMRGKKLLPCFVMLCGLFLCLTLSLNMLGSHAIEFINCSTFNDLGGNPYPSTITFGVTDSGSLMIQGFGTIDENFIKQLGASESIDNSKVKAIKFDSPYAASQGKYITLTSGYEMFKDIYTLFPNLSEVDLSLVDMSNITTMQSMFESTESIDFFKLSNCKNKITKINLSGLKGNHIFDNKGLDSTFSRCALLTDVIISDDLRIYGGTDNSVPSKFGLSISHLFFACSSLKESSINNFITKVDLSNLTDMSYLFFICDQLSYVDLRNNSFDNKYIYINGSMEEAFYNTHLKKIDWQFDDGGIIVTNATSIFKNGTIKNGNSFGDYCDYTIDMTFDFNKIDLSSCELDENLLITAKKIILPQEGCTFSTDVEEKLFIPPHYAYYDKDDKLVQKILTMPEEVPFGANNSGEKNYAMIEPIYKYAYEKYYYVGEEVKVYDFSNNGDKSILGYVFQEKDPYEELQENDYVLAFAGSSSNGNESFYNNDKYQELLHDYNITYICSSNIESHKFKPTTLDGFLYNIPNLEDTVLNFNNIDFSELNSIDNFLGGTSYTQYLSLGYVDLSNVDCTKIENFIDWNCVAQVIPPLKTNGSIKISNGSDKIIFMEYDYFDQNEAMDLNDPSIYTTTMTGYQGVDSYDHVYYVHLGKKLRSTDKYDLYLKGSYDKVNKYIMPVYAIKGFEETDSLGDENEFYCYNPNYHDNKYRGYVINYIDNSVEWNNTIVLYCGEQSLYKADESCDSINGIETLSDSENIKEVYFADDGFIAHDLTKFCYYFPIEKFDGTNLNTNNVTSMCSMFEMTTLTDVKFDKRYNTNYCEDFSYMFNECELIEEIDLSNFTSNSVTKSDNYTYMFSYNYYLKYIDISKFNFLNSVPNGDNELNLELSNISTLETIKLPYKVDDDDMIYLPDDNWILLDSNYKFIEKYNNDVLIDQSYKQGACYLTKKYVDASVDNITIKYKDSNFIKSSDTSQNKLGLFEKVNGEFINRTFDGSYDTNINYDLYLEYFEYYQKYAREDETFEIDEDYLTTIGNGLDKVDIDNDGIYDYLFVYPTDFYDLLLILNPDSSLFIVSSDDDISNLPFYGIASINYTDTCGKRVDSSKTEIQTLEDVLNTIDSFGYGYDTITYNMINTEIAYELFDELYYITSNSVSLKEPMTKDKLIEIYNEFKSEPNLYQFLNIDLDSRNVSEFTFPEESGGFFYMLPLHFKSDGYRYQDKFDLGDYEAGLHTFELRLKGYFDSLTLGRSNSVNVVINKLNLQEEGTNNKLIAKIDDNGIETIDKDSFDKSKINEYISKLKVYYINNIGDEKLLDLNKDYTVNHYENDDKCIIEITGKGSCINSYNFKIGDMDAPDPVKPEPKKPDNDPQGGGSNDKPNITTQTIAIGGTSTVISGYVNGYNDKSFKPNKSITRGELCKMVASLQDNFNLNDVTNLNSTNTYTDVSTKKYYAPYIGFLTKCKVINGYTDKTFKPEDNITRAEVCKILSNMYVVNKIKDNANYDKEISGKWYEDSVRKMIEADLIKGYPDGKFKPDEDITRAEVVALLNRIRSVNYRELTDYQKNYIKENYNDIDTNAWYYKDLCYALTNMQ
ncbi:MAG: S-layer homology domain-containing protein [Clostridia bacterium]|nr:S-layer homology domain-containing protein [Clostridia bacterium]